MLKIQKIHLSLHIINIIIVVGDPVDILMG